MPQPAATDTELMLRLPIPHELTLMIIEYLDLVDLVTLYCLNSDWTKTFDRDAVIRSKMFRPPRSMKYAARAKWVQEQWKKLHDKIQGSDRTAQAFWHHIRVNPYLEARPHHVKHASAWSCVDETYCMFGGPCRAKHGLGSSGLANPHARHVKLPKGHETQAQALIASMFVSYPPVTRTELYGCDAGSLVMWPWPKTRRFSASWQERAGYRMGQVCAIAQGQPGDLKEYVTEVRLWPEMLWRIEQGVPLEDDEDGEAGRSDDVAGDGNGSDGDSPVEDNAEDAVGESGADQVAGNGNVSDGDSTVEEYEEVEGSEDEQGSEYEPESGSDYSD